MNLRKAAKAVLFCVIAAVLYLYLYRVLSWKDTGGDYQSTMDTFYTLDEDVVDVAFLGSSHCYCAVNTAILWEQYGMAAYSLSISGQDMASSYFCLKEMLKTQRPRVVCVEMYYSNLEGYQVKGNLYRNLLGYRISRNFADAVESIAEDEEKWDILLKWPIIHTRYAELKRQDFEPDPQMRLYMGWETGFSDVEDIGGISVYQGEETLEIPQETEEWLLKIIALAREEDVELCFFLAPFGADERAQMQYKYAEKLARENGVPFLNMIDLQEELQLDTARDFSDKGHTNSYGAEKVTEYLGKYLDGHYNLEDKRGGAQYTLWDENLMMWKHQKQNQILRETTDLGLYLDSISGLEGYTVIMATRGEYLAGDGENLAESLADMGIDASFFQMEGAWVVEDGAFQYGTGLEDGFRHMEIGGSDAVIHGNDGQMHIIIERQEYMRANPGIDILLYDNILEEVADIVGFQAAGDYICIR